MSKIMGMYIVSKTPFHNPAFDGGVNISEDSCRINDSSPNIYRKDFTVVVELQGSSINGSK